MGKAFGSFATANYYTSGKNSKLYVNDPVV